MVSAGFPVVCVRYSEITIHTYTLDSLKDKFAVILHFSYSRQIVGLHLKKTPHKSLFFTVVFKQMLLKQD